MRLHFLLIAVACAADFDDLDCKIRELAYDYAQQLQGSRGSDKMKLVHDSLQLTMRCNQTFTNTGVETPRAPSFEVPTSGLVAYVDTNGGKDESGQLLDASMSGKSAPFATIQVGPFTLSNPNIQLHKTCAHNFRQL
jgi:hypothetical protein